MAYSPSCLLSEGTLHWWPKVNWQKCSHQRSTGNGSFSAQIFCLSVSTSTLLTYAIGWWLLSSDAARFPFLVSPFASCCSTEHHRSMIYAWLRLSLCFQMPTWGLWLTLPCGSCLMALWCSSAYAEHLDISTDRGISWGSLCISEGEWGSAEPCQMPWGPGLGLLYCV